MPALLHGGPGRAGGGEELGGERGLRLYLQRCALEGDASVLKALLGD
jgi:oxepin-CoA hydrolase/3-oxo-5,6-dehydrosuberyl-CoA semialdehyde dehydrogenase